jgi:hypothetical protein
VHLVVLFVVVVVAFGAVFGALRRRPMLVVYFRSRCAGFTRNYILNYILKILCTM